MHSTKARRSVVQQRQLQAECRAFTDDACTTDMTTMTPHNSLDHGQPQPQTFAALGGIEAPVLA